MTATALDTQNLHHMLVTMLARQLRIEPENVVRDRPFTQYGLDSLAALTLAGELQDAFAIELESTLLWDCPTIDELASYLGAALHRRDEVSAA